MMLLTNRTALAAAACAAMFLAGPGASAQDEAGYIEQANDLYQGRDRFVSEARRSDRTLLPALAAMQPPPQGLASPFQASLLIPGESMWAAASEWAAAEPQRAAIEALRSVSAPGGGFAFLLEYGADAVSPELRDAGLYVDLGEPPLLAGARFLYLDHFDALHTLVQIEATRLLEAGEAGEALAMMADWTVFGRQMANREFAHEQLWGVRTMLAGLERARDIALTAGADLTSAELVDTISDLDESNLGVNRITLPRANKIAGQQLIAKAFVEREGPSSEQFGPTLALASSSDRPLRLFGEAARWQDAAQRHASTFETIDQLNAVFGDWDFRWRLPRFDRVLEQPSDYDRMDRSRFAVVDLVASGINDMFALRTRLLAESRGTRLALASQAFFLDNRVFPPSLAATRPRYISRVEPDPYTDRELDFHYFIPIKDQPRGERDLPRPHEIIVSLPEGTVAGGEVALASAQDVLKEQYASRLQSMTLADLRRLAWRDRASILSMPTGQELQARLRQIPPDVARDALAQMGRTVQDGEDPVATLSGFITGLGNSRLVTELRRAQQPEDLTEEALRESYGEWQAIGFAFLAPTATGRDASLPASLADDTFVLYAAGPDRQRGWARNVGEGGDDLLLWPPILTILRGGAPGVTAQAIPAAAISGPWPEWRVAGEPPAPPAPPPDPRRRGGPGY